MATDQTPTPALPTTQAELQKMIADAIAAASTGVQNEAIELDGITFDYDKFGEAIAKAITATGRKKVTIGEYVAKLKIGRSVLTRRTFQHGYLVQPVQLSNKEIDLLNQITHGGRYYDRLVEVLIAHDGPDEVVYINWNGATGDQRNEVKAYFRNFTECLEGIVAEQKKEDAEVEKAQPAMSENARRSFGNRKSTRDAEAAAALR